MIKHNFGLVRQLNTSNNLSVFNRVQAELATILAEDLDDPTPSKELAALTNPRHLTLPILPRLLLSRVSLPKSMSSDVVKESLLGALPPHAHSPLNLTVEGCYYRETRSRGYLPQIHVGVGLQNSEPPVVEAMLAHQALSGMLEQPISPSRQKPHALILARLGYKPDYAALEAACARLLPDGTELPFGRVEPVMGLPPEESFHLSLNEAINLVQPERAFQ